MGIFFGKIFRAILMFLDDAVYGLAEMVYRLFVKISETGIFSQGSIQEFAGRIYFFLGLAMLFKVLQSFVFSTIFLNCSRLLMFWFCER